MTTLELTNPSPIQIKPVRGKIKKGSNCMKPPISSRKKITTSRRRRPVIKNKQEKEKEIEDNGKFEVVLCEYISFCSLRKKYA